MEGVITVTGDHGTVDAAEAAAGGEPGGRRPEPASPAVGRRRSALSRP